MERKKALLSRVAYTLNISDHCDASTKIRQLRYRRILGCNPVGARSGRSRVTSENQSTSCLFVKLQSTTRSTSSVLPSQSPLLLHHEPALYKPDSLARPAYSWPEGAFALDRVGASATLSVATRPQTDNFDLDWLVILVSILQARNLHTWRCGPLFSRWTCSEGRLGASLWPPFFHLRKLLSSLLNSLERRRSPYPLLLISPRPSFRNPTRSCVPPRPRALLPTRRTRPPAHLVLIPSPRPSLSRSSATSPGSHLSRRRSPLRSSTTSRRPRSSRASCVCRTSGSPRRTRSRLRTASGWAMLFEQ